VLRPRDRDLGRGGEKGGGRRERQRGRRGREDGEERREGGNRDLGEGDIGREGGVSQGVGSERRVPISREPACREGGREGGREEGCEEGRRRWPQVISTSSEVRQLHFGFTTEHGP